MGKGKKQNNGSTTSNIVVGIVIVVAVALAVASILMDDVTGRRGSGLSQAYDVNAQSLSKFDPNLIAYEEVGVPVTTGLYNSREMALDCQGRLYVVGDSMLNVLSPTGNLEKAIELGGQGRCVTLGPEGKIYVGTTDHVEIYDPAGEEPLASWEPLGPRAFLTSIVVAGKDVFVADAGNAIVLRYDTAGKLIGRIGEKDPDRNIPGFFIPGPNFDLAMAADGLLRAANPGESRIEAYTVDGDLEFHWGELGNAIDKFCGCCNPVNFAMLPDGGYVTAEKGLIRVKTYNADGTFRRVVAGPDDLIEGGADHIFESVEDARASGFDVAVDAEGRIYVLDTIKNIIRTFAPTEKGPGS